MANPPGVSKIKYENGKKYYLVGSTWMDEAAYRQWAENNAPKTGGQAGNTGIGGGANATGGGGVSNTEAPPSGQGWIKSGGGYVRKLYTHGKETGYQVWQDGKVTDTRGYGTWNDSAAGPTETDAGGGNSIPTAPPNQGAEDANNRTTPNTTSNKSGNTSATTSTSATARNNAGTTSTSNSGNAGATNAGAPNTTTTAQTASPISAGELSKATAGQQDRVRASHAPVYSKGAAVVDVDYLANGDTVTTTATGAKVQTHRNTDGSVSSWRINPDEPLHKPTGSGTPATVTAATSTPSWTDTSEPDAQISLEQRNAIVQSGVDQANVVGVRNGANGNVILITKDGSMIGVKPDGTKFDAGDNKALASSLSGSGGPATVTAATSTSAGGSNPAPGDVVPPDRRDRMGTTPSSATAATSTPSWTDTSEPDAQISLEQRNAIVQSGVDQANVVGVRNGANGNVILITKDGSMIGVKPDGTKFDAGDNKALATSLGATGAGSSAGASATSNVSSSGSDSLVPPDQRDRSSAGLPNTSWNTNVTPSSDLLSGSGVSTHGTVLAARDSQDGTKLIVQMSDGSFQSVDKSTGVVTGAGTWGDSQGGGVSVAGIGNNPTTVQNSTIVTGGASNNSSAPVSNGPTAPIPSPSVPKPELPPLAGLDPSAAADNFHFRMME